MMMLYIAGPMTGLPGRNYPAFHDTAKRLASWGYGVKNPALIDVLHPPSCGVGCGDCDSCRKRDWRWYMRRGICMMLECDGVALLPGYHRSRGAVLEVTIARGVDMEVMHFADWIACAKLGRRVHG